MKIYKKFYTVEDLIKRWDCSRSDIYYLAGENELTLSIDVENIAAFDGNAWSSPGAVNNEVLGLALSDDGKSLYACGNFNEINGVEAAFAAKYDISSSEWSALDGGTQGTAIALTYFDNKRETVIIRYLIS